MSRFSANFKMSEWVDSELIRIFVLSTQERCSGYSGSDQSLHYNINCLDLEMLSYQSSK